MSTEVLRKLTTVLAADAAGYSRLMETDEVRTLDELRTSRTVFRKFIERHRGRIANTAGDGLIAEFPSVVEAVQCAIEVQRELANGPQGPTQMQYRIGIHLGDVIVDGDDLLGEGVNLAARLQAMAEPGGVLISQQVYDQVHAKLSVGFDYLGEKRPKNYSETVPVYRVSKGERRGWFNTAGRAAPTKAQSEDIPAARTAPRSDVPGRMVRNAKLAGIVLVALLVLDLTTGAGFWAHWPGLIICALLALQLTPLVASSAKGRLTVRLLIIALFLVLVNVFSWSGTFWAIWPSGAAVLLVLLWQTVASGRKD